MRVTVLRYWFSWNKTCQTCQPWANVTVSTVDWLLSPSSHEAVEQHCMQSSSPFPIPAAKSNVDAAEDPPALPYSASLSPTCPFYRRKDSLSTGLMEARRFFCGFFFLRHPILFFPPPPAACRRRPCARSIPPSQIFPPSPRLRSHIPCSLVRPMLSGRSHDPAC